MAAASGMTFNRVLDTNMKKCSSCGLTKKVLLV